MPIIWRALNGLNSATSDVVCVHFAYIQINKQLKTPPFNPDSVNAYEFGLGR